MSDQPRRPEYLRTATTPRMLLVLLLLLGAAAVCGRLGVWQLDRATVRGEVDAARAQAEAAQVPPEAIDDVLAPGDSFAGEDVGRKVVVTGTFGEDVLLVPGRALDGETGVLVLSPFEVQRPGVGAAVLAVVRGWAPSAEEAADAAGRAPAGEVELVGYLAAGEAAGAVALPSAAGIEQVEGVSPAQLVNRWGGPIYPGYLVHASSQPAADDGLRALGAPMLGGGGVNIQNLAYALQWWIFGAFAVLLWVRMVRDAARAELEDDEDDDEDDDDAGGGGRDGTGEDPRDGRGAEREETASVA